MGLGSGLFTKPSANKPHIVKNRSDGLSGEVGKLRADLVAELAPLAAIAVEEWTNPTAASTNAIKTDFLSATTAQVFKGADLNGTLGGALLAAPRRISVTQVTAGDHYLGSVTIKGLDAQGKGITDTIALVNPGNGNDTTATTKYFAKVTEVDLPAQKDATAHLTIGTFGATLGLARPPKSRTGALFILQEIVDGSVVTNGTLTDAATAPPYGAYTPNTGPNGVHDYSVKYEYDATA